MAGRSTTNWDLYLTLIGMGMAPQEAVRFVNVSISTPYTRAMRNPRFRAELDEATTLGMGMLRRSPHFWLDPYGEPVLDADFNMIPREPASAIWNWVWAQVRRNPMADLVA